ncbi:MAG: ABC transporter ATP-binding protein, partial [Candidatus Marinimicrobia bacterium]|nr:ABC transporter ATP-binding protein [Candidatus Neomarinimicrobiota bacterium]
IFDNLLLASPDYKYKHLELFFKKYDFSWFFQRFPQGLLTNIGEDGRQLSGGERFIIAFIRALLTKPSALIIDEGLSSLDVDSRKFINNILDDYIREHILIIIAHHEDLIIKNSIKYFLGAPNEKQ